MSLFLDNKYVRLISSRLRNFKQKKDNLYNFSCPFCGDSKKNLTKARGYVYPKGNDLFYTCYNCGHGTNTANLIKQVDPSLHDEYMLERYSSGETKKANTTLKQAKFDIPTPKFKHTEKCEEVTFEHAEKCVNLPNDHPCMQYLINRKIPNITQFYYTENYRQFIDTLVPDHGKNLIDDARLIIPYYDENKKLIAVSGRSLEKNSKKLRYITIRTNDSKEKLIYGLDRIKKDQTIYIVEGPIDSLFLNNCIASGDANLTTVANKLVKQGIKKDNLVLISDNEPRNKQIMNMVEKAVKAGYNVVIWPDNIKEKDINDMMLGDVNVSDVIKENTYRGLEAQTKFVFWKKV